MRTFRAALLGSVAAAVVAAPAFAENLTIGVSIETPSIDPHFFSYKPSHQIAKTIFDPIVKQDINQQLIPGLAESWRLVDDNTWEFKLRKGVVWHDGTPFTADDIGSRPSGRRQEFRARRRRRPGSSCWAARSTRRSTTSPSTW